MHNISLADNGNEVMIYLNREILGKDVVENIIEQINKIITMPSIPYVSDEEQVEIEAFYDTLNPKDLKPAIRERITISL